MAKLNSKKTINSDNEKEEALKKAILNNIGTIPKNLEKRERTIKRIIIIDTVVIFILVLLIFPLNAHLYLQTQGLYFENNIDNVTLNPGEFWSIKQVMDEDFFIDFSIVKKSLGTLFIYLVIEDGVHYYGPPIDELIVTNITNLAVVENFTNIASNMFKPTHNDTWYFIVHNWLGFFGSNNSTKVFDLDLAIYTKQYKRWNYGFQLLKTVDDYYLVPLLALISFGILVYQYNKWKRAKDLGKLDEFKIQIEEMKEEVNLSDE